MTLAEKAIEYAHHHLQAVRIVWMDKEPEIYDAVAAVKLCSDRCTSGRVTAAVAQDKALELMLNRLIDGD